MYSGYKYPKDTEDKMYLTTGETLETVLEKSRRKWPGIQIGEIDISAQHIQVKCFGYDLYDASDYWDYTVVICNGDYIARMKSREG